MKSKNTTPKISEGNAFRLVVPLFEASATGSRAADLSIMQDLAVELHKVADNTVTEPEFSTDGNLLKVEIPATYAASIYRMKVRGVYNGADIAANMDEAFEITEWGEPPYAGHIYTADTTITGRTFLAGAATEDGYLPLADDINNEEATDGLTAALQQAAASRKAVGEALGVDEETPFADYAQAVEELSGKVASSANFPASRIFPDEYFYDMAAVGRQFRAKMEAGEDMHPALAGERFKGVIVAEHDLAYDALYLQGADAYITSDGSVYTENTTHTWSKDSDLVQSGKGRMNRWAAYFYKNEPFQFTNTEKASSPRGFYEWGVCALYSDTVTKTAVYDGYLIGDRIHIDGEIRAMNAGIFGDANLMNFTGCEPVYGDDGEIADYEAVPGSQLNTTTENSTQKRIVVGCKVVGGCAGNFLTGYGNRAVVFPNLERVDRASSVANTSLCGSQSFMYNTGIVHLPKLREVRAWIIFRLCDFNGRTQRLPALQTVSGGSVFSQCDNLQADLPVLQEVSGGYLFQQCDNLQADLPALQTVSGGSVFSQCDNLQADLPVLQEVSGALIQSNCVIKSLDLPNLKRVVLCSTYPAIALSSTTKFADDNVELEFPLFEEFDNKTYYDEHGGNSYQSSNAFGNGDGSLKKLLLPAFSRLNLKSGGNAGTSYGASFIYCGGLEELQVGTLEQWDDANTHVPAMNGYNIIKPAHKLAKITIGQGTAIDLNLCCWNPTEVESLTALQDNFLHGIVEKLSGGTQEEPQVVTLRQWMCDLMQQREDITDAMDAKNITLTAKEHANFAAGKELN